MVECPAVVEPGFIRDTPDTTEDLDGDTLGQLQPNTNRTLRARAFALTHAAVAAMTISQPPCNASRHASARRIQTWSGSPSRRTPKPPNNTTKPSPTIRPANIHA